MNVDAGYDEIFDCRGNINVPEFCNNKNNEMGN